jgi:methyl-accepting chemotaxis protein
MLRDQSMNNSADRGRTLSIQWKLILPITIIIVISIFGCVIVIVSWQTRNSEDAYRRELTTLSNASVMMLHSEAEEYAKSRGMEFYRGIEGSLSSNDTIRQIESDALNCFKKDTACPVYCAIENRDNERIMYTFSPAIIRDECITCHNAYGMDVFGEKKDGDLVGTFGIAASLAPIDASTSEIRWIISLAGFGMTGIILTIVQLVVRRAVVKPITSMVGITKAVSGGDFTKHVEARSSDEIGNLGTMFNCMIQDLRDTLMQVTDATNAVTSVTAEISSSTERMATGAQEQSTQTGEVASAMEEMNKTILETTKNTTETAAVAKRVIQTIQECRQVVGETVDEMKRIADVTTEGAATVKKLSHSSEEIGKIIGVIDDIADQTNLLALNAAIEAARAGDQGRGFAVVADEVRKLAERTTKATKEIAGMIKQIQSDTASVLITMDQESVQVNQGVILEERTSTALASIFDMIQTLTDRVNQIAVASEEQSATSEEISKNIEGINSVMNESATGVQQIARAAENMNRLTENLARHIVRFRLKDSGEVKKENTSQPQPSDWIVGKNGSLIKKELKYSA